MTVEPFATSPRTVVVIVNYKTAALTLACLKSLQADVASDPSIGVVVVDNQSGDVPELQAAIGSQGWQKWVKLIAADRNGGFSYGNNRGIELALQAAVKPDYLLLLNPDTEARGKTVQSLVTFMDQHPKVGIAGSSIENEDGSLWPFAFRFGSIWSEFERSVRFAPFSWLLKNKIIAKTMPQVAAPTDWVAGACMMVRREVIDTIGLMDEKYFLYFEEVDYCLGAKRKGWPCWYVPQSRVMHISGKSTGLSGANRQLKRIPNFWYASRCRYWVKNYGLAYARAADLAFISGMLFYTLRRWLLRREDEDPPQMFSDFCKTSSLFRSRNDILAWIN